MAKALRALLDDLRHVLKALRRSVPLTLAAIALLATCIALATAAFAVLDTLVLRRLPSPHPDQLVVVSGEGLSSITLTDAKVLAVS